LYHKLLDINKKIWDTEDEIREKERNKQFDQRFIDLARSVYANNDIRADIKKQINISMHSDLIEEKSYNNIL
jgi:DNA-binding transcriptional regulator PaaX